MTWVPLKRDGTELPRQRDRLSPLLPSLAVAARQRRAQVEDVHELALAMPSTSVSPGSGGNPVYQVGGKSFVFFRNPRPDATDPLTGERSAE